MNGSGGFRFDHARHAGAAELRPEHGADFQRLVKTLCHSGPFQLLFVECGDWRYRGELTRRIDAVLAAADLRAAVCALDPERHPDFAAVEAEWVRLAADHQAVHVTNGESWFDRSRWEAFNIRRESVAQTAPLRLLLWLTAEMLNRVPLWAPDLWAWRGGVFSFEVVADGMPMEPPTPQLGPIDTRSLAQRGKRIAVLRAFLKAEPPPPDDLALPLLDELADLLESIGQLDDALRIRVEECLPVYERLGDVRSKAVTQGRIADILQARGQLDDALRIRVEEQLPVYERLGDVREKAMAQGQIADILQARGQLDDALRIRVEECVPVYERLGDVRSKAVTQGQIADILQARGQLDDALRIRAVEELPVYERLGDVRSKAVTQGQIADILQARGQLDDALRIRVEECVPVFERLGDVRSKAITQGKIADILQARGQLDDALRILVEECVPILERLGDVPMKAVAQGKIADILEARGQLDDALRIRVEEELPVCERLGDVRSKAITQGKIADILEARGQLDDALRIRVEECVPVFERLGDVREKAVTLFDIARIELEKAQHAAAFGHLAEAYEINEKLKTPDGLAAVGGWYGQLLWAAGERERGLAVLETARDAAALLGRDDYVQRLRDLLEQLRHPPEPPTP